MVASSGDEAVHNARQIKSGYSGMCQKFTRVSWEVGSLYGSAIDAWNGADEKHSGDRTPPVGAPCYYRGGSYGHAVVYVGNGKIRSTDCPSAGQISEVDLNWPEVHWGYPYLGWTGDINEVDLPLNGKDDDDMPLSDKDIQKIADAVWAHNVPVYDKDAKDGEKRDAKVMLGQTHNRAGQARDAARRAAKDDGGK